MDAVSQGDSLRAKGTLTSACAGGSDMAEPTHSARVQQKDPPPASIARLSVFTRKDAAWEKATWGLTGDGPRSFSQIISNKR